MISGYLLNEGKGFECVNTDGKVLKRFEDEDILVGDSSTPDLREAVGLAQKDMDDKINNK